MLYANDISIKKEIRTVFKALLKMPDNPLVELTLKSFYLGRSYCKGNPVVVFCF